MKVGKAGSAGPHAAYIAREGRYANRIEHGEKLEGVGSGNMPAWAVGQPGTFWFAADAYERKNGTTYREMEIALPRELSTEQRALLVHAFVDQEIGDRHAYQWAIHVPTAADGGEQPHLHLMFSERQVDGFKRDPDRYFKRYNGTSPEKGGARKGYGASAGKTLSAAERAGELKALRQRWESLANVHLMQAGVSARIDMRSHAERGTGEVPEKKQLPSQWRDGAAGKSNVIEFRAAKQGARLVKIEVDAAIYDLREYRKKKRLEQENQVKSPKSDVSAVPDPATRLAKFRAGIAAERPIEPDLEQPVDEKHRSRGPRM